MSGPYYLGWGSDWEGGNSRPDGPPYRKDNQGTSGDTYGYSASVGFDPAYGVPTGGVVFFEKFTPADGSDEYTTVHEDVGVTLSINTTTGVWPTTAKAGVTEITANVGGVPCGNKLVLATSYGYDESYAALSWYSEDTQAPKFWTRFNKTVEVV